VVTWFDSSATKARSHLERFGADFDLSRGGYAQQVPLSPLLLSPRFARMPRV